MWPGNDDHEAPTSGGSSESDLPDSDSVFGINAGVDSYAGLDSDSRVDFGVDSGADSGANSRADFGFDSRVGSGIDSGIGIDLGIAIYPDNGIIIDSRIIISFGMWISSWIEKKRLNWKKKLELKKDEPIPIPESIPEQIPESILRPIPILESIPENCGASRNRFRQKVHFSHHYFRLIYHPLPITRTARYTRPPLSGWFGSSSNRSSAKSSRAS